MLRPGHCFVHIEYRIILHSSRIVVLAQWKYFGMQVIQLSAPFGQVLEVDPDEMWVQGVCGMVLGLPSDSQNTVDDCQTGIDVIQFGSHLMAAKPEILP